MAAKSATGEHKPATSYQSLWDESGYILIRLFAFLDEEGDGDEQLGNVRRLFASTVLRDVSHKQGWVDPAKPPQQHQLIMGAMASPADRGRQ